MRTSSAHRGDEGWGKSGLEVGAAPLPVPLPQCLSQAELFQLCDSPHSPFHAWNFKDLRIYLLPCSNYWLGCACHGLSGRTHDATQLFDRSNLSVEVLFLFAQD